MPRDQPEFLVAPKGLIRRRSPADARGPGRRFIAELRSDHAEYSRVLSVLSREIERLPQAPQQVLPLLADAFEFITAHMDAVHHPREDVLFERLARRSRRNARKLTQLRKDHHGAAVANGELSGEIAYLMRNPSLDRLSALSRAIDKFVDETREHIGAEERIIYADAVERLDAADWSAIQRAAPRMPVTRRLRRRRNRAWNSSLAHLASTAGLRHIPGRADGVVELLGIDKAGYVYGEIVGHGLATLMLAGTQGREAAGLAVGTVRMLITPRSPAQFSLVVVGVVREGFAAVGRWSDGWRSHFLHVTSACVETRSRGFQEARVHAKQR